MPEMKAMMPAIAAARGDMQSVDGDSIYPNGISTSVPKDVQDAFIHSIPGLENVKILRYAYAIEYTLPVLVTFT